MVSNRTKVPALRMIGLAIVLVASGLVPTVQQAEASHNALGLESGPYFASSTSPPIPPRLSCQGTAVVLARPATGETQVHTIQVQTSSSALSQVIFAYDLVADPGSSTTPGLGKALTWNDTRSSAAGWVAVANNAATTAGGIRTLTFTASGSSYLQAGPGVVFTFAFEIPSSALGNANGGTPDSFPIRVSSSTPEHADARFCIRMDNTPPTLSSILTRDTDYDGRLDMLELTFSEELEKDSLHHAEFAVKIRGSTRTYSVLTTSPPLASTNCNIVPTEVIWGYPCPKRVILKLAPGPSFDTGELPDVTYPAPGTNGTLTDLAGNKLAPIAVGGVNTTDRAKPVLVSALAKDGSNRIVVTFSEPVRGSGTPATTGGPKPVRVDPDTCQTNCQSDFLYWDNCYFPATSPPNAECSNTGPIGTGDCIGHDSAGSMPPQVTGATHTPTGPTANQVTITIGTGSGVYPGRYPKAWGDPNAPGWTPPSSGTNGCTNGQLGAGDTQKTFGDQLDLNLDPQGRCIDTQRGIYDFLPCGSNVGAYIRDASGLTAVLYKHVAGGVVITGPYIDEAEVNINSFRLTLKFNGPVTSASGDSIGIQLQDLDIVSADDSGQGPSGIVAINHTAGSDEAILTLDHPTRPTDVDDTPARVRVSCASGRGVKAFGQSIYVPCTDPNADNRPDVGMVDRTPPAFTAHGFEPPMSTVDADRNGYIDGIKLRFSEPIDDSSFCAGPIPIVKDAPNPAVVARINQVFPEPGSIRRPPRECAGDGFFDRGCLHPETHSILIVNNIPGPYTFDTDLLPDDDEGIIRFPETPGHLQTTGFTPAVSTNPCWTNEGYFTFEDNDCNHDCHRGTGMFYDQSHEQPASPPYAVARAMKRVCGEQFGGDVLPICFEDTGITVKVFDGAPPALWTAKTIDTPKVGLNIVEGDGFIDGYVLTFSEPVNDCSFRASEWNVAGHRVLGFRTNVQLGSANAICPPPRYPPQGQGNPVLVLRMDDGSAPDTDAKPELTYLGPSCNSCGLRDLNGQAMAAFGTLALNEEDDSPPVITCVRGFVGRSEITVEFSEPVDNGDRGGLIRPDFVYGNGNQNFNGATGISVTDPVVHTAGARKATMTLNAPLVSSDFNDTMMANFHSIYEVAPTVVAKKVVSTQPHALKACRGLDTVAPANVTNLQVVEGLSSANSVTLSWTAPGNDGNELSNVTGYQIKVSTSRITPADFSYTTGAGIVQLMQTSHAIDPSSCTTGNGTAIPNCVPQCMPEMDFPTGSVFLGGLILQMEPRPCNLAQPGQVQRAKIVGLNPDTAYHFAVVAFDNATDNDGVPRPNFSGMGSEVTATTGKDSTPPSPAPVIFSTIPPYRASKETKPEFHWSNSTDEQSQVVYFVKLTNKESDLDYQVKVTDEPRTGTSWKQQTALSPGTYTFHVAAISAGGSTPTAHYTILVGAAPIEAGRIQEANDLLARETKAYRVGDQYNVTWQLPPLDQIQARVPGGELEGIQIVRMICVEGRQPAPCERTVAHTERGTYDTLKTGSWTDNMTADDFGDNEPYYRVELMFASGQTQDQGNVAGFVQAEDVTPRQSPLPWLIGIILLAAALAALVAWWILRSRSKAAQAQITEEPPAGVDPETGLPTHDVKCPSCSTPFQAVGTLPLQITCPNCGVSGMLE